MAFDAKVSELTSDGLNMSEYLNEELNANDLVDRIKSGFETPQKFHNEFGSRSPAVNTVKKLFKYVEGASSDAPSESTLAKVRACLRIPNWKYKGFEALREQAFLNQQRIDDATLYAGRYRYFRYNSDGNIADGGLLLEARDGITCFYHFNKVEQMRQFDPLKVDHNDLEALHQEVSHIGFYFIEGDRVCFIAIGKTYFRSLIGMTNSQLANSYFRLGVLTRDSNSVVFAARSIALHESNPLFKSNISDEEITNALSKTDKADSFFTVVPRKV